MTPHARVSSLLAAALLLSSASCREHAPSTLPSRGETPDAGSTDAGSPADPGSPPAADTTSQTFTRMNGGAPRPAWFVCDGTNVPRIAVVERTAPGPGASATLTWLDKGGNGPSKPETLTLGAADPGAGQIYYKLSRGAQEAGFVHAVNPGMLFDPSRAWTPTVGNLRLDDHDLTCRWLMGTRVMGFDGRRSVLITQEGQELTYTTFDFADAAKARQVSNEGFGTTTAPPSLQLKGGTEAHTAEGSTFTFHNGAYTYVVGAGRDGFLQVVKEGSPVQRTELLAWTSAPPR